MYNLDKYKHIHVSPLGGVIGAEIEGVDVTTIDDAAFREIRQALNDHHVIFFRDQELDAVSLAAFAERFAPLKLPTYTPPIPDHPMVTRLFRSADMPVTERNIGDLWHSDGPAGPVPNMALALYCTQAPPYGGDTLFTSLCAAYERLSPAMKERCANLIGVHSYKGLFGMDGRGSGIQSGKPLVHKGAEELYDPKNDIGAILSVESEHPIVCTHPETSRPILYVTGAFLMRFKGMTEADSASLIQELNHHAVRPDFTCRFRWKKGSLAILDNRCTQHYAVNDYAGFEREMLRTEMQGERPYGPAMPRANPGRA